MNANESGHTDPWKASLDAELSAWRLRASALAKEIERLTHERAELDSRIKAAETLLGRPHVPGLHVEDGPALSVRAAIQSLMKDGKARTGKEIRSDLIAAGYDQHKLRATAGAFYTALARLVETNVLVRLSSGAYRVPTSAFD